MRALDLTRWPTIGIFAFAGLVGACFAFITVNLFTQAVESLRFISEFGFEAVRHGALLQVAELFISGALSLFFWVSFKASEHALIERYFDWAQRLRHEDKRYSESQSAASPVEVAPAQESDRVT